MRLSRLEEKILEALLAHPEGLTIGEVRTLTVKPDDPQEHLNRRIRAVRKYYVVELVREAGLQKYVIGKLKPKERWGEAQISAKDRAQVLHKAGGRCQMCGRTIAEDGIKLVIDHKIPQSWGGGRYTENLWGICEECNLGKRDYFATFDAGTMKQILRHQSVHRRILSVLEMKFGEWVESDLLEFVANFSEPQQDWHKRLRELRYLDLIIETVKGKQGKRIVSMYRLTNRAMNLPEDLTAKAREYERERAKRNRMIAPNGRPRPDRAS